MNPLVLSSPLLRAREKDGRIPPSIDDRLAGNYYAMVHDASPVHSLSISALSARGPANLVGVRLNSLGKKKRRTQDLGTNGLV